MNAESPNSPWRAGNRVRLLENGEEFYPQAFAAIAGAKTEILLETFIWFEDKVGLELHRLLVAAAERGVRIEVTVDGYGSPGFAPEFLQALTAAGVKLRVYDPHRSVFGMRLHVFRRLHRKLLVIDARLAFVGGLNYSADHLGDFGPQSKQDYAVAIEGPVVADIHHFARAAIRNNGSAERWRHPWLARAEGADGQPGDATVLFEIRDNALRSNAIEREYRTAIRGARSEIVIANAYFFPGYRLLHALKRAAQRGVRVALILQGEPDKPVVKVMARALYRDLVEAGVEIYEYCERPFHGKVALVDDDWATVGSSNLDPLSLSLNLEANVFIRDEEFNQELRSRLEVLQRHHCQRVNADNLPATGMAQAWFQTFLFHASRHFPVWAGYVPAHTPRAVLLAQVEAQGESQDLTTSKRRTRRDWLVRGISLLVLAIVVVMLARYAREIDWPAIGTALKAYESGSLALAAALVAVSYLLYGGYEIAARAYVGHGLTAGRVLAIACTSYAFNLNLGVWVGGGAIRYRLYARSGIKNSDIARIIAFSFTTNWLGYLVLAGGVFALDLVAIPERFASGLPSPRIFGMLLLAAAAGYLLACALGQDRSWTLRGVVLRPPSLALASAQLALSIANWLAIAGILFVLMGQQIDYGFTLGVVLIGAVAAAITHIPGGLGALEAVFLLLIGGRMARADLLAALLVYRGLYYLTPLLLATIGYIGLESGPRLRAQQLATAGRSGD